MDHGIIDPTPRKQGAVTVPANHLQRHGITREEAAFLKAIVKASNRDLDGYNLLDSMALIKDQYEVRENRLIEMGYLKRHCGTARRVYYTVTRDGQEACQAAQEHGRGFGDLGDDTPHRVGAEIARRYFAGQGDVQWVEISPREFGAVTDLAVFDINGGRVATVEVEAGRVSADPGTHSLDSAGTNNLESIRKDYHLLAEAPGKSVWVVRTAEIAGTVLRALSTGSTPITLPLSTIEAVEAGDLRLPDLNARHIDPADAPGMDEIVSYQQLRHQL